MLSGIMNFAKFRCEDHLSRCSETDGHRDEREHFHQALRQKVQKQADKWVSCPQSPTWLDAMSEPSSFEDSSTRSKRPSTRSR